MSCQEVAHVLLYDDDTIRGWPKLFEQRARGRQIAGYKLAEEVRYNERSAAERVNARLKDEFGGRYVRVRGHAKILCHLMFGILSLTCDQLMRLII